MLTRRSLGGLAAVLGLSAAGLKIEPVKAKVVARAKTIEWSNDMPPIQRGGTRIDVQYGGRLYEFDFLPHLPIVGQRVVIICEYEDDNTLWLVSGVECIDEGVELGDIDPREPVLNSTLTKIGSVYLTPTGIQRWFMIRP